jgi:predicted KAP-like P-loop ATPase
MPPTPSPTYERLRDFITRRMRMGHVDQALMLMELIGHGLARQQPAPPRRRT